MLQVIRKFAADTKAATAVEYAIVASVISVAALGAFISVGEQSEENMTTVADKYAAAQGQ